MELGGGILDRRDVLDLMHGRSRMTIDHRGGRANLLLAGGERGLLVFGLTH